MKENSLLLDKFSSPYNHPLLIAKMAYELIGKECHIDDTIKSMQKKRKTRGNLQDEVRIIQAIGLLIALNQIHYYKGYLHRP